MSVATLFLCGDVMTGRGIDQVMPHPVDPQLYEPWVRSAREYVALAERVSGPIASPVDEAYIWGDALDAFARSAPDARIVNLETAVTTSERPWPGKQVHYRMNPQHVGCLQAAGIDCCVLANNHVLDWGREGLAESLRVLHAAGLNTAGAGGTQAEAEAPAVLPLAGGQRVLVYACGMSSSGVPHDWAATDDRSGVAYLPDLSAQRVEAIAGRIGRERRKGDIVVFSIHWGSNWGYEVSDQERAFAHALVDRAQVDVVHGHSSHHVKGLEIYHGRPIFYGCGDFLNDYEGIDGFDAMFRGDLSLMYFARFQQGRLEGLRAIPTTVRSFRIQRAAPADARDLLAILQRQCERFDTEVHLGADGALLFSPAAR